MRSTEQPKLKLPGTASVAGHTLDRGTLALLFTLGLGVFAGALDLGVLSPALPALAGEFGVAPRDLAWTFTLYLLATVVSIPITTKLSDRNGRRSVYVACVATFAAGSALAILSPNFTVFLIARVIQAAGAGGIFPVAAATIGDKVPQERRGAALGILGAIWGVAAIVGPALGGIVTHFLSWHWIFVANVPLAVLVILLAKTHVPALKPAKRGPLDIAGIATLSVGLLAVMVGLTRLDTNAAAIGGNVLTGCAIAVALVAFILLGRIEKKAAEPVVSMALLANRQIAVTYALEVAIGTLEGALFFIPAALVAAEGVSAIIAGFVAAIGAVMFVVVIPGAGRALDRFGSRAVLMAGALCTAIGLAIFAFEFRHLAGALGGIVIAGIGFGALLGAPTRYIITNEVSSATRATAVGLLSIFLIIGQICGGSLAGGIVGNALFNLAGYRTAYLAFAAIALCTALGTLLLKPRSVEIRSAKP